MKEVKQENLDNKVAEWDSTDPQFNEKLQPVVLGLKYSFALQGIKIGFVTMTVDQGIMTMNNVLLAFPIQEEPEIMKFIVYRKVILIGNNLIYPS